MILLAPLSDKFCYHSYFIGIRGPNRLRKIVDHNLVNDKDNWNPDTVGICFTMTLPFFHAAASHCQMSATSPGMPSFFVFANGFTIYHCEDVSHLTLTIIWTRFALFMSKIIWAIIHIILQ
jgi:hypothetical protein